MRIIKLNKYFFLNSVLLLLIFSISIAVRYKSILLPLGRHHESITAHVLNTVYRYSNEGAAKFHFLPVVNFDSEAERKCSSKYQLVDKDRNYYYYSYPAFAFLFPYFAFATFHVTPSVLAIRVLGLCIHFVCALFMYLLILELFNKKITGFPFVAAFAGFVIYLFAAGNLWFHCHLFFADVLVQPFILALLLMLIRYFKREETSKTQFYSLFFFTSFIAVYTEYFALFFCAGLFISLLILMLIQKNKKHVLLLGTVFIAAACSALLNFFQYVSVFGFDAFIKAMKWKYAIRGGHDVHLEDNLNADSSMAYDMLSSHYENNYGYLLSYAWACLLLMFICLFFKREPVVQFFKKGPFLVFSVILFSFLLHLIIFFNFNALHDFGTLKSTLFFIPFIAITIGIIHEYVFLQKMLRALFSIIVIGCTLLFAFASVSQYNRLNHSVTRVDYVTEIPRLAKKYGKPELLLASNIYHSFEVDFYCKRRIEQVPGIDDFYNLLHDCNINEGIYIVRTSKNYKLIKANKNRDTLFCVVEPLK